MELSSGSSSTQFNPDQYKSELQSQIAEAYYQEFLEDAFRSWDPIGEDVAGTLGVCKTIYARTLRKKCFDKCITKPGSSLSGGESSCITKCIDLYYEATIIITKELVRSSRG